MIQSSLLWLQNIECLDLGGTISSYGCANICKYKWNSAKFTPRSWYTDTVKAIFIIKTHFNVITSYILESTFKVHELKIQKTCIRLTLGFDAILSIFSITTNNFYIVLFKVLASHFLHIIANERWFCVRVSCARSMIRILLECNQR